MRYLPSFRDCNRKVECHVHKSTWKGLSALHIALLQGHNEITQLLLSAGISPVEEVDDSAEGHIAKYSLSIASASSIVDVAALKQLYNATTTHPDRPSNTEVLALKGAVCGQDPEKLKLLLDLGVVDLLTPHDVRGPLAMAATIETQQEAMLEILLSRKDLYPDRYNTLKRAKSQAEEYLVGEGRDRRPSVKHISGEKIITMLDREITISELLKQRC